jgi:hypothetical protein
VVVVVVVVVVRATMQIVRVRALWEEMMTMDQLHLYC